MNVLEHPEIAWAERTGYPSWLQETAEEEWDQEDRAYEESRERQLFGDPE